MKIRTWLGGGFLVLLVFGIGFVSHLPASFVIKHYAAKLPEGLTLSQPKGTVWQGQVNLSYQGVEFEQVAWRLGTKALFNGLFKQTLSVALKVRNAQEQLDVTLVFTPENLSLSVPQGQLDIGRIAQAFAQQHFMLRGLQGQLHFRDLALSVDFKQAWLQSLSGQLVVTDLAMMGEQVEQLNLNVSMQQQTVMLALTAEEAEWALQGLSRFNPPNRFDSEFELNTQQPNRFPDWALMTMQQTSPTEARAQMRGQW